VERELSAYEGQLHSVIVFGASLKEMQSKGLKTVLKNDPEWVLETPVSLPEVFDTPLVVQHMRVQT